MMSAKYSISGEFIICCVSRSFCRFEIVPLLPFIDDFLLAETLSKVPEGNSDTPLSM
jgi:hypothetical protein